MMLGKLQWDSDFFQLSIGRLDVCNIDDWKKKRGAKEDLINDYDLVYVFAEQEIDDTNISLVDIKTIYTKSISGDFTDSSLSVEIYNDSIPNEDLYQLALASGAYSRFRLDKHFPPQSYDRLYECWMQQSTNGKMADKVFVHRCMGKIDGMITLKVDGNVAHIGLVAVDTMTRGKGIGSQLIQAAELYLLENTDVRILNVATQWENTSARRLYEKNGFSIESRTHIYHWWLK